MDRWIIIAMVCATLLLAGGLGLFALSKKKGIELSADNTNITVKAGEGLFFKTVVHYSVGISWEMEINNSDVVNLVNRKFKYLHPENMKKGMTGGDKAVETYYFKAKQAGIATLTFKKNYRGKIENEVKFTITVE